MRLPFCKEVTPPTPHLADVCRVQPQTRREDQSGRNPELLPTKAELLFQQVFFPSWALPGEETTFILSAKVCCSAHISVLIHVCEHAAESPRDVPCADQCPACVSSGCWMTSPTS